MNGKGVKGRAQGVVAAYYDEKKDEITRLCTKDDLRHLKKQTYNILRNELNVKIFFDSMISKIKDKYKKIDVDCQ